jgi:hypothetical protein
LVITLTLFASLSPRFSLSELDATVVNQTVGGWEKACLFTAKHGNYPICITHEYRQLDQPSLSEAKAKFDFASTPEYQQLPSVSHALLII